jgi:hypothetical protein
MRHQGTPRSDLNPSSSATIIHAPKRRARLHPSGRIQPRAHGGWPVTAEDRDRTLPLAIPSMFTPTKTTFEQGTDTAPLRESKDREGLRA